jgi:ABC-type dipeptide/oligopeptide/nickel transport system permease subunit
LEPTNGKAEEQNDYLSFMKGAAVEKAWIHRLRRNKGALIGLAVITFAIIVALFCYFIAPDPSPNANRIILEIGGEKPGFTQSFVLVRRPDYTSTSLVGQAVAGKEDAYEFVPIENWVRTKDSIVVQKFIDVGLTERRSYAQNALATSPVITKTFLLGTDKYGRDILSRLIIGTRVSLSVGVITVLISLSIGVIMGSLAGYFGGRTDALIMWIINIIWSIPTLLLVFAVTLLLGKGFWQVFIAVGLTIWYVARYWLPRSCNMWKQLKYLAFQICELSTGIYCPTFLGRYWLLRHLILPRPL